MNQELDAPKEVNEVNSVSSHNLSKGEWIYRAYRTLPDGTKIYASSYGKKAFKIFIPDDVRKN